MSSSKIDDIRHFIDAIDVSEKTQINLNLIAQIFGDDTVLPLLSTPEMVARSIAEVVVPAYDRHFTHKEIKEMNVMCEEPIFQIWQKKTNILIEELAYDLTLWLKQVVEASG